MTGFLIKSLLFNLLFDSHDMQQYTISEYLDFMVLIYNSPALVSKAAMVLTLAK